MTVRLYEGCWGVTRDGEVVGPFALVNHGALSGNDWWVSPQIEKMLAYHKGNGKHFRHPVKSVHPSESCALAWVNRKPWWKRNLWPWLIVAVWVSFLVLAVWAFTGCSDRGPTSPGNGCAGAQVWSPKDSAWVWETCQQQGAR